MSTKPLKTKVSITLDESVVETVKELAEEDDRNFSQYINWILHKKIRKKVRRSKNILRGRRICKLFGYRCGGLRCRAEMPCFGCHYPTLCPFAVTRNFSPRISAARRHISIAGEIFRSSP